MESKILELQKMVSKYKTTWSQIQEQMNEFTLVYVARWRGKDGKRYASPFKTKDSAEKRAKELRTQGNSEVSVTQDTLKGNIKWAKDNGPDIKGMQKEAIVEDGHTDVPSSKTMAEALRQVRESNPMGYTVKFANSKGAKIATAWYKDEADAKKALEMIKKNGGNGIISKGRMDEETIVEDGHEDVSSSKRMAQVIAEDAQLILQELNKKSDEETLPTWWTNKLATSAHNMNAARDYISNDIKEDLEEATYGWTLVSKAKDLVKKFKDNITKAVAEIEKLEKGLSKNPTVDAELKKYNESLEEAMSDAQLKKVRDSYKDLKTISPEKVKTLRNFLDRYSTDSLMQLAQANINFVSTMARSVMNKRKMGDPKHAGSMREEKSNSERIADLRTKQMMLQTKVRDMDPTKDKTDIEIAKNKLDNIQLRMDKIKSQNEEVHPAKALIEAIEAVKNKAEKTGMPYSILKQVYDRGMAAWKGGHRPGTTPQQWALARVNSFVTKSSGTWGGADSDLAKKVRSKK